MTMATAKELRRELRKTLPVEAFEPQPLRGVVALLLFVFWLGLAGLIVSTNFPWFVDLFLSLIIGECMASILLCAHESMHGAVFRSSGAKSLLAWAGFGPLLITPGLWKAWHNLAHHRAANNSEIDPDTLTTIEQYEKSWTTRIRAILSPGSGYWVSYVGFFILFTLEGQFFLWIASGKSPMRDRLSIERTALRITSVLWICLWMLLAIALGPLNSLWVLLVPLAVANCILMVYISTQHWLRPQMQDDDPFCSSTSINVPWWVDLLHFRFSYHQEHHIFPNMSPRFAPLVRNKLRELEPRAVAVLPFGTAIKEVLRIPAIYANHRSLSHADGSNYIDLHDLSQELHLPSRLKSKEPEVVDDPTREEDIEQSSCEVRPSESS